jgi:hypothetical protein
VTPPDRSLRIDAAIEVRHNAAASRFETTVDGLLCVASYHRVGNVMRITTPKCPACSVAASPRIARSARVCGGQRPRGQPWCGYVRAT